MSTANATRSAGDFTFLMTQSSMPMICPWLFRWSFKSMNLALPKEKFKTSMGGNVAVFLKPFKGVILPLPDFFEGEARPRAKMFVCPA